MIIFIFLIAYLVSWVVVLFNALLAKRIKPATINCYVGSLGQGKSYIGVGKSIKSLLRSRLLWLLGIVKSSNYENVIEWLKKNAKEEGIEFNTTRINNEEYVLKNSIPLLYSNIPIVFKNKLFIRLLAKIRGIELQKYENSVTLEYEHLVLQKPIREYSAIFIDEIGDIADQYSYDNPFIIQYLQLFIRFFRHFIDGTINLTDQATDNITKPIRIRIGRVYLLKEFRRFLFHWYKVDVLEVLLTQDVETIQSSQLDDPPYFFGYLPYKYLKKLDWTRIFTYKK